MSIKEIKSGTLYKEYALEIPYEEINKIIESKINEIFLQYPYQVLEKEKLL